MGRMIRECTIKDIPAMIDLSMEFFDGGVLDGTGLTPDRDTFEFLICDGIDDPNMTSFVLEIDGKVEGYIAGCVRPWLFNAEILVLTEMVWFVRKEVRATNPMAAFLLLKALKKWGKALGAKVLHISSTVREESPKVIELFNRLGLKLADHNYVGRM